MAQALAHQAEALRRSDAFNSYAFFMETGTGKTFVGIERIRRAKALSLGLPFRALIVCPRSIIEQVWKAQLAEFAPDISFCNLRKCRAQWKKKLPAADVYAINYESLRLIPTEVLRSFNIVILDESTKIKNPRAQITKFVLSMKKHWPRRDILSGLPAPNHLMEYWPQMNFVNSGILGDNFWRFRAINFYNVPRLPYLWRPTPEFQAELPGKLAKQAIVVKKKDCLDLPPQVFTTRTFEMTPGQRKHYDQMVEMNITTMGGKPVLAANELAKVMKLRQLTSGFAVDASGQAQEFRDPGKLALLEEVLEQLGESQAVIWVQFHVEIAQILKKLEGLCGVAAGTVSEQEQEKAIEDFKAGRIRYLIAHPGSVKYGHNWTHCTYAIYFSLSYSLEEYKQSMDRIHRYGQDKGTTYIHLLAERSIDSVIYKRLQSKSSLSEGVLQAIIEAGRE